MDIRSCLPLYRTALPLEGCVPKITAAIVVAVASNVSAQQSDSPLMGNWVLVSYVAVASDGSVTHPAGPQAIGHLSYSAESMAVQILPRGIPTGPTPPWVQEGYLGYFGPYTIDPKANQVTNTLEGSSHRAWIGSRQLRTYTISGEEVTFEASGMGHMHRLRWKRVR